MQLARIARIARQRLGVMRTPYRSSSQVRAWLLCRLALHGCNARVGLRRIPSDTADANARQVASVSKIGASIKPHEKKDDNLFRREDISKNVKRVVIKVGTSVLTRDQEFGVSLTRLASLVEQVSALVHMGKEVIIVTSGAVGFGKMKLQVQTVMSQTVRNTLSWGSNASPPSLDSRACAAAGQSGLMTLYDAMFSQYGVSIAQILVTMSDFQVDAHRANMCETIQELLSLGIVPICNENDVFYSNTESREFVMSHQNNTISTFNPNFKPAHHGDGARGDDIDSDEYLAPKVVRLTANDSLTALLAVQLDAQLMIMLSDVDGVYTAPPGRSMDVQPKLLHTYNPDDPQMDLINFGRDNRVGRGGMAAKVESARFALNHGVHCILGNGHDQTLLQKIFEGRSAGTLFTRDSADTAAPHVRANEARAASRELVALSAQQRRNVLETVVQSIGKQAELILAANHDDMNVIGAVQAEVPEQVRRQVVDIHVSTYPYMHTCIHIPDQVRRQVVDQTRNMVLSKRKLKALAQAIESIALQAGNTVGRNECA